MRTRASCNTRLFELCYTKLSFERRPALKFCVTQSKEFLVLQLMRVRIQTALLLSCVWCAKTLNIYIHTYHSRFFPEGVAEAFQIFLRDAHVLPKLLSYEKYCRP
jgi:hypothetical protein